MSAPTLMSVPNVSEGRSRDQIAALARAFAPASCGVRLLDVHSDADHHRSVFTLAGTPLALVDALLSGAHDAVERVDVVARAAAGGDAPGQHPHVGALDVVPIVYLSPDERGAACAAALVVADRIASELAVPVFLYGELTSDGVRGPRTRAELRAGGVRALQRRMSAPREPGGLTADFGPAEPHPTAGATLVAARPPLVAFNLQLAAPADLEQARHVASLIREGGPHGIAGVRAIGVLLQGNVAQVSTNIEDPFGVPLARVVEAVRAHASVAGSELVGLVPEAAMEGFPHQLLPAGFDRARHVLENALGS